MKETVTEACGVKDGDLVLTCQHVIDWIKGGGLWRPPVAEMMCGCKDPALAKEAEEKFGGPVNFVFVCHNCMHDPAVEEVNLTFRWDSSLFDVSYNGEVERLS
jgi:hypothetical protein